VLDIFPNGHVLLGSWHGRRKTSDAFKRFGRSHGGGNPDYLSTQERPWNVESIWGWNTVCFETTCLLRSRWVLVTCGATAADAVSTNAERFPAASFTTWRNVRALLASSITPRSRTRADRREHSVERTGPVFTSRRTLIRAALNFKQARSTADGLWPHAPKWPVVSTQVAVTTLGRPHTPQASRLVVFSVSLNGPRCSNSAQTGGFPAYHRFAPRFPPMPQASKSSFYVAWSYPFVSSLNKNPSP